MSRIQAFYKMVSLVRGTNIVRKELGLEEVYIAGLRPRAVDGSGGRGLRRDIGRSASIPEASSHPNALLVTEVWETPRTDTASLEVSTAQDAISRRRSPIAALEGDVETEPLGGIGLKPEPARRW